jgi:hypothetical protein
VRELARPLSHRICPRSQRWSWLRRGHADPTRALRLRGGAAVPVVGRRMWLILPLTCQWRPRRRVWLILSRRTRRLSSRAWTVEVLRPGRRLLLTKTMAITTVTPRTLVLGTRTAQSSCRGLAVGGTGRRGRTVAAMLWVLAGVRCPSALLFASVGRRHCRCCVGLLSATCLPAARRHCRCCVVLLSGVCLPRGCLAPTQQG